MNRESAPQPIFHQCDLRDQSAIDAVFKEHEGKGGIWAVVHLAALKAVGESGEIPLEYYKVNVGGSLNLIEVSLPHPFIFRSVVGREGETDNR
jgi:UDP-glucose 4-epimerase